MDHLNARRLWRPFSIFVLFAGFTFWNRDLLLQFGSEALSQSQKVIAYGIQIGIWLSAAHLLNRLILVLIWDGLVARTIGSPIPRLIKDISSIVVYVIAVTGIVGVVFGQSVTGFWATSGVVGIIVGFALRDIILDVFTGLAVNIDRPYKLGDWVKVHGSSKDRDIVGRVAEVNWRTTRLETEDDSVVIMPNSLMGSMVITNFWGAGPHSRFETSFCLDFSVPTERAFRILLAGARAVMGQAGILEQPAPNVIIHRTAEMGINYAVRYWMGGWGEGITQGKARSTLTNSILSHLSQAGITLAYPKQDIYHANMPTRQMDLSDLEDRSHLLAATELFRKLEASEIKMLAAKMEQRQFTRGDKVIMQGDAGDSMFILSEGLLYAYLSGTHNGHEIKVGQIVPGEFFGEMSLLTGEPRGATLVAITDVVAHEITKEAMNELLSRRPRIARTISQVVAERKVRNSQQMATATVEERQEQTESLARQIMSKMRGFFKGVFEKSGIEAI